jgi:hypothetical protein
MHPSCQGGTTGFPASPGVAAPSQEEIRGDLSIRPVPFVVMVRAHRVPRRKESTMSVITNTTTSEHLGTMPEAPASPATTSHVPRPVWRVGLVAGVIASAVNSAFAIVAHRLGVSLEIAGEQIPVLGFAQLTMVGALVGVVLAAVLARRSRSPRAWFVRVTVALTVLSIVPDITIDADLATRIALVLTHLIAAGIVIPVIARRLSR